MYALLLFVVIVVCVVSWYAVIVVVVDVVVYGDDDDVVVADVGVAVCICGYCVGVVVVGRMLLLFMVVMLWSCCVRCR